MDLGLAGRWALVCGASKGLGYGCALALAQEGAHVVLVARGAERLSAAVRELRETARGQVQAVAADIATEAGRAAVLAHRAEYDVVVTNAGGPPPGDFHEWDRAAWMAALDANMLAPIALMRATVDGMVRRRFGRIVHITSSAVKAPIGRLGLSNGARSGLTGFVAGLARDPALAASGVTINNLLPGTLDTDRLRSGFARAAALGGEPAEAVAERRRQGVPARRFGTAEEFGAICAFLCSLQAGYLTGQNILVDGGDYPGTF